MNIKEAKKLEAPQCPECGYWNVKVMQKKRVDFYGRPIVWHCPCGWEKEIVDEN